jgi:hypothetical protein
MMCTRWALLLLAVTATCLAAYKPFDLLEISHLGGKGRVQDQGYHPNDPQINSILAMGKDAIPLLIESLESERPYRVPPLDYWPEMVEGDIALVVLSDLFLDPTWERTTLPEMCWNKLLGPTSEDVPAWDLLHHFVETHGRIELANLWRQVWAMEGQNVAWDSGGQFFKVEGRELTSCAPNKSLERTREE